MVRMFVLGIVVLVGIALLPTTVWAHVVITEIAYDVEGGDAGFEWIEVHNTGSSSVDLTEWKFREGGVNHGITLIDSSMVGSGSYAIIADDPLKFSSLYSSYNGLIFDSSFSLSNTGEELAIIDPNGIVAYQTVYASEMGAAGDGNTLNRVNGSWGARAPTPGAPASGSVSQQEYEDEDNQDASTGSAFTGSVFLAPVYSSSKEPVQEEKEKRHEPHLVLRIKGPTDVMVGTIVSFQGEAQSSVTQNNKPNTRFSWNFGDGSTARGEEVEHVFRYPGVYTVYVEGKEGFLEGETMLEINVHASDVTLTPLSFGSEAGLQMGNNTELQLDLSGWSIDVDGWRYLFPAGTRIAPSQSAVVTIPGARIYESSFVTLFSEGGRRVTSWKKETTPTVAAVGSFAPSSASIEQTRVDEEVAMVESEVADLNARLAASVGDSVADTPFSANESTSGTPWFIWVGGILGLAVIGMGGVLLLRRAEATADPADEYEILEE